MISLSIKHLLNHWFIELLCNVLEQMLKLKLIDMFWLYLEKCTNIFNSMLNRGHIKIELVGAEYVCEHKSYVLNVFVALII